MKLGLALTPVAPFAGALIVGVVTEAAAVSGKNSLTSEKFDPVRVAFRPLPDRSGSVALLPRNRRSSRRVATTASMCLPLARLTICAAVSDCPMTNSSPIGFDSQRRLAASVRPPIRHAREFSPPPQAALATVVGVAVALPSLTT